MAIGGALEELPVVGIVFELAEIFVISVFVGGLFASSELSGSISSTKEITSWMTSNKAGLVLPGTGMGIVATGAV